MVGLNVLASQMTSESIGGPEKGLLKSKFSLFLF